MARPAEYGWSEGPLLDRLQELAEAHAMIVRVDGSTIWFDRGSV
jgi:hypothetical protein